MRVGDFPTRNRCRFWQLIILLASLVKFEDTLRLYPGVEQLLRSDLLQKTARSLIRDGLLSDRLIELPYISPVPSHLGQSPVP